MWNKKRAVAATLAFNACVATLVFVRWDVHEISTTANEVTAAHKVKEVILLTTVPSPPETPAPFEAATRSQNDEAGTDPRFDWQRCASCEGFTDSPTNERYQTLLTRLFAEHRVTWWADEGGLIGASRGGAYRSADDDFDFFAVMPGQLEGTSPCMRTPPDACEKAAWDREMHAFLLLLWNAGLCINNFDPDLSKFDSQRRLMWSIMLDRSKVRQPHATIPGKRCYDHKGGFAHMHLGIISPERELHTNVWSKGHPRDKLPLSLILPVTPCKAGNGIVPCPNDVVGYLMARNNREYATSKSEGSCLLIRKKWGVDKKKEAVASVEKLNSCGCNSLHPLVSSLVASNYETCHPPHR
ncbi:hypothetical protein DIPPA_08605 [Diplonema papillatum]|nr:hypothetical protein DIPPA_08605 [Diplonema papillatum]